MYKMNNSEQCNLIEDKDHPVTLKTPKQIPSDSLQKIGYAVLADASD